MSRERNFIAVDLGASSGRVIHGRLRGERFALRELHRFPNAGVRLPDGLHWNALGIWTEVSSGLRTYTREVGPSLDGVSVDTWGVDFGLLDSRGRLLANPWHYRDGRTNGVPERLHARVPLERIYASTGIQSMQINTLYQLFAMVEADDPLRSLVDLQDERFVAPADMRAALRGFCRDTGQVEPETAGELVRCCLESLALTYRRTLRDLEALTSKSFSHVRIVGGGSRNPLLNRFTADACAIPVVAGPVEATALGNVMLQALAEGYLPDLPSGREAVAASVEVRRWEPRGSQAWSRAAERFEELSG